MHKHSCNKNDTNLRKTKLKKQKKRRVKPTCYLTSLFKQVLEFGKDSGFKEKQNKNLTLNPTMSSFPVEKVPSTLLCLS